MAFKIELTENLRTRLRIYYPGVYRVPRDMPEDIAVHALAKGAHKLEKPLPPPPSVEELEAIEQSARLSKEAADLGIKIDKRWGLKRLQDEIDKAKDHRKTPAPENKVQGRAPENKSELPMGESATDGAAESAGDESDAGNAPASLV